MLVHNIGANVFALSNG